MTSVEARIVSNLLAFHVTVVLLMWCIVSLSDRRSDVRDELEIHRHSEAPIGLIRTPNDDNTSGVEAGVAFVFS